MKYLALFATALCTLGAFPAEPGHGTLIAHRGESVDAPENTLPAYKTAVERGFGFECDVYLSKDGRVFTFHDFIAFNGRTCKALKAQMPEYKVLWLTWAKHRRGERNPVTADEILKEIRNTGADGVDCHYDPKVVSADFIKTIRDAGFEFHVWTVDDLPNAREAFKRGVQTVTTNCANKLLDEYRKTASARNRP